MTGTPAGGYTPDELATKLPPLPPLAHLRSLSLEGAIRGVPEGTEWWRVYKRGGNHPTRWDQFRYVGPLGFRFDHHLSPVRRQRRGILYLGGDILTCIAETFQATRYVDRERDAPWLVAFQLVRSLQVLDLTSLWPTRAGASTAINDGPRAVTRNWSRAIYEAYPDVDGLWYGSSMAQFRPCIALYERGRAALPARPTLNRSLSDPALLDALAAATEDMHYLLG